MKNKALIKINLMKQPEEHLSKFYKNVRKMIKN